MAESSERHSGGVARRRRERRMRSWFRHEQQSIRMALATVLHHSYDRVHTEYGAPRSQNTATRARGGGESDEKKYTAMFRKTPPLPAFFQLYDEEDAVWGVRLGSVFDPVPQGRVERHVVEHRIETCPFVQILDAPVPQLGDQVLELLQKIVTSSSVEPVQVIEVPKVFPDRVLQRIVERCPPQTAEQLVEVPTQPWYVAMVLAEKVFSKQEIRRILAEMQGRGGGARGGLPGSRTGQDSTANLEQIGEYPVPQVRWEGGGSVQGSLPVLNSAAVVEQNVGFPARRVPGFLSGQGSASSSSRLHDAADEDFTGVFRTFPVRKKSARSGSHLGSELPPESSPSTRRAYEHPNAPG